MKRRIAVLISGSGTNLQALIDACSQPDFPASIALVISNKADAYGLERAKNAGIQTAIMPRSDYASRTACDHAMHRLLLDHAIELVCLAGFMRLLSTDFVEQWHRRMLNIHPSLLPAFKGARAIDDALAAGAEESGCTVHYVVPEMDAGPVIMQAAVPVLPSDTKESLSKRIHAQEHRIYPQALRYAIEALEQT